MIAIQQPRGRAVDNLINTHTTPKKPRSQSRSPSRGVKIKVADMPNLEPRAVPNPIIDPPKPKAVPVPKAPVQAAVPKSAVQAPVPKAAIQAPPPTIQPKSTASSSGIHRSEKRGAQIQGSSATRQRQNSPTPNPPIDPPTKRIPVAKTKMNKSLARRFKESKKVNKPVANPDFENMDDDQLMESMKRSQKRLEAADKLTKTSTRVVKKHNTQRTATIKNPKIRTIAESSEPKVGLV